MKRWSIVIMIAFLCLLASTGAAAAQGPITSETLYAGAYQLRVDLYSDPPFTGRRFNFDVLVTSQDSASLRGLALTAAALPDASTNATPVVAVITPAGPFDGFKGSLTMPVRGGWRLRFRLDGAAGSNTVDLPLQVSAPGAIPIWLAWAIALAPLLGLLAFAIQQRSYLSRLQRPPKAASPVASVHVAT